MPIIGRTPPADILIPSQEVSSRHAELQPLGGGRFLLTDLGSTNGTFVNGRRIRRAEVTERDEIRLGGYLFDLRAHAAARPFAAARPSAAAPGTPRAALAVIAIAIVLLLAGGLLVATQQTVTQQCEVCRREIYRERAFFYEAGAARARAARHRWCGPCGAAPVTVEHISRCEYCRKVIAIRTETRPRREEPRGSDQQAGFCSEQCRMLHTGREIYREGKSVIQELAPNPDTIRNFVDKLVR